ncbi:hypothetical protein NKR23_g3789 [Pleurostoma richardsiae]|uniref:Uncharacterized protein n=1 Tax=Pleurostoma richardsiae TaxID=41990 RepID=A0AA38RLJ3_9PEZI|nr:hypothetical protein NKR23_g3789 [Pleurostoma richardsiae]
MLLKRKRSDSELSFSSNGTFLSSPPRPIGTAAMDFFGAMDTDQPASPSMTARSCTPAHLPSRTLKRFRDSRPSDEEVHQHTLNLLYSAAAAADPQPQHVLSPPATTIAAAPAPARNQPSLHSFWNLPSAPSSASSTPCASTMSTPNGGLPVHNRPTSCEDCGAGLGSGDDSMDVDGYGLEGTTSDHACGACGKAVCFSCSVSNLGEQRRCLMCAGRKVWVGGIGWATAAGVGVC